MLHNSLLLEFLVYSLEVKLDNFPTRESFKSSLFIYLAPTSKLDGISTWSLGYYVVSIWTSLLCLQQHTPKHSPAPHPLLLPLILLYTTTSWWIYQIKAATFLLARYQLSSPNQFWSINYGRAQGWGHYQNEGLHYFVKTLSWVCALRKDKSNLAFCFQFFPVGTHKKENNARLIYENRMPALCFKTHEICICGCNRPIIVYNNLYLEVLYKITTTHYLSGLQLYSFTQLAASSTTEL